MRASFLAIAITLFCSDYSAAQQIVNVRNAGAFSCEEVLSSLQASGREIEKTAFLQWTAAYATAASRSNGLIDVFPIGDTWELLSMTALVCRENPQLNYESALRTAIFRLQPYWVRTSSDFVTLTDPLGRTVQYYVEGVRPLQEALIRLGGQIQADGAYGNQTGNTIRRLNEARGSTAWMTPDGELLYQLTIPQ